MKNYKKIVLGMFAIAALVFGYSSFAKADNERGQNGQSNRGNENQMEHADQNDRDARDAGTKLEVHLTDNGKVIVRGAKITAINGTSLTATTTWGSVVMSWTVNTDNSTNFVRRFGGSSGVSEMAVGDIISFKGNLVSGTASPVTVLAKTLKDWSIQKKNATFEGNVSSITGTSFVLARNNNTSVTVNTTSATQITKGNLAGVFADITVGAKVSTTGIFNNLTNVLDASKVNVKILQPEAMTKEGTIKSIAGTTAPTTLVLTSGGTDYTVRIVATTSILTNNWLNSTLTNFVIGNNIRVYGIVNADNTIDATVIRNTNL